MIAVESGFPPHYGLPMPFVPHILVHRSHRAALLLVTLGAFSTACSKEKTEVPQAKKTEQAKQARIDALLKENGSVQGKTPQANPFAQPPAKKHSSAAASPSTPASGKAPAPVQVPTTAVVTLQSSGNGPKKELRYAFELNRKRSFEMDMTISTASTTNGQKAPSPPPISMAIQGASVTKAVTPLQAQRETTFLNVAAKSKDLPPQLAAQMNAQFSLIQGIQLIESVTTQGEVTSLQLKDPSQINPAVLGMIQSLKDGMTNAFVPLPQEPVGIGAQWKSSNTIVATGMSITQTNEVELLSLNGTKAEVKMTFTQSAPSQELKDPRLPPEAKIELLKLVGGGSGKMTFDLAKVIVDGMVDLKMNVETKVSGPMVPAPQTTKAETGVKIHMRLKE